MKKSPSFLPIYDRIGSQKALGNTARLGIALGAGFLYVALQYLALPDKAAFLRQYCWVLGAIISASLLALYTATDLFRNNLQLVNKLEGRHNISQAVMDRWLTDRGYILSGCAFAALNTLVGHLLGVPQDFHASPFALTMIYSGFMVAGFTCGMGLYGIVGASILYLKLSPCLHYSLDPMDPDGAGGIKRIGDALWTFGALVGLVGLLVSIYLFGVQWTRSDQPLAGFMLIVWAALPYIAAISIILVPGLAVRRNVQMFKQFKATELRNEHSRIYSELKQFREGGDQEIISENRELTERLNDIQTQLDRLQEMRNSHLDRN